MHITVVLYGTQPVTSSVFVNKASDTHMYIQGHKNAHFPLNAPKTLMHGSLAP